MLTLLRNPRFSALLLIAAAVIGLIAANTPIGPALADALHWQTPLSAIGLDLTVTHWVGDGLLAVFFLTVAIELRHELTRGELSSPRAALPPAIAAIGGVIVPALLYVVITTGSGLSRGWPIPTATDIAFALGIIAAFGRGLPSTVRVFLLALAVLDDLIAIIIIAVVFAHDLSVPSLIAAAVAVTMFAFLGQALTRAAPGGPSRLAISSAMLLVGVAAWWLVLQSGIHATIAGVALGAVLPPSIGHSIHRRLEPIANVLILPLFAFVTAAVRIPDVGIGELSPAFWAIVIALPVGKTIGISVFGGVATRLTGRGRIRAADAPAVLPFWSIATVGVVGGVGFTVSLLMNELAFADNRTLADENVLAVLIGSGLAIGASAVVVPLRAHHERRVAQAISSP